jgi:hypothetical protein
MNLDSTTIAWALVAIYTVFQVQQWFANRKANLSQATTTIAKPDGASPDAVEIVGLVQALKAKDWAKAKAFYDIATMEAKA